MIEPDISASMAAVESYRSCERLNHTGIPREYRDAAQQAIAADCKAFALAVLREWYGQHAPLDDCWGCSTIHDLEAR